MKNAFVTGVTGQDGYYLTKLLLSKNYMVHGLLRRTANDIPARVIELSKYENFKLYYGDLTDSCGLVKIIGQIQPDEIYNLAAQSHVRISFDCPEATADFNAIGVLRLLEAIRVNNLIGKTKFYQASTSELYGKVVETPQTEDTLFYPRSPYGVAKLYAYWIVKNYNESYGLFGCNGILFNHESPIRGENFVTRKITKAVANISKGLQDVVYLGNIDAQRDWGHAKDYVEAMYLMLQQDEPDDYVVATGKLHSVRELIEFAFNRVDIKIKWQGSGVDEIGINIATGKQVVGVNPEFYRPAEVELLLGDASKARNKLDWQPKYTFEELIAEMVEADL